MKFKNKNSKLFVQCLVLILVALIFITPIFWLVSNSFKSMNERLFTYPPRLIPQQPTLNNFREAIDLVNIFRSTFNSFVIAISTVALNLLFCSLTAYPLARMNFAGKNGILILILATFMIPTQAIIVPLFILVQKMGLVDTYAAVILPLGITAFGIFLLRNAF